MKNLLYLLMILPFAVKVQSQPPLKFTSGNLSLADTVAINWKDSNIYIAETVQRNHFQLQADTIKIVMLVSDTSTVKNNPGYQDTRPFMMYGYQTKKGELLDAYKQKLSKNIVMWIAYKTK